ncbi:MAG TPA: prepilin peptidase [Fimbriimonadaceae bacterium]|nr:prepilin peptidase [Fimbriimonadaceae bacterium]
MLPEWFLIFGVLFGAAIGSFLNVVIYRLPRGLTIAEPKHSFCPSCKNRLTVLDLFPLLSWLVLRGRCRHCRAPIGFRYFLVELVNAAIWGVLWWQYLIAGWDPARFVFFALFASALLVALVTDLEHFIIPDEVNAFLLVVGFGYHGFFGDVTVAVYGALLGWGMLWGIALLGRMLFGKDAMGHGDIKMARGIGALLGPQLIVATFFIAVFAGAVGGIVQVVARRKNGGESEEADGQYAEPESIPSLVRCGLGYLLLIDVIALFAPKANRWFGDEAQQEEIEDDWEPGTTTIPFGPYLAVGAVASAVFATPISQLIQDYIRAATAQPIVLEQTLRGVGPTFV